MNSNRYWKSIGFFGLITLTACVRGEQMRVHTDFIETEVERLHEPALLCEAEREIAMAEAHLDFALYEMQMGNVLPAQNHVTIALENIELVEEIVGDQPICFGIMPDADEDTIFDDLDNCVVTPNTDQADMDNDGIGDVCDDSDEDTIFDSVDNCVNTLNINQADRNNNGIGDACDDSDEDTIFDSNDNCVTTHNTDQADMDNDAIGDVCDDSDDDTIFDSVDNCVTNANEDQADFDEDGIGDVCDEDVDGDGILNQTDNCVWIPNPEQTDINSDGIGDACSDDRDGDGISDIDDACPDEPEDFDGYEDFDGCPEFDNDLDGMLDEVDACPNEPEDFDGDQDEDGCPDESGLVQIVGTMIQINDQINFELNSDVLTGDISFQILDEITQILLQHDDMDVRIEGHTDGQGSASYNLELSQNRANSVRSYLLLNGVTPSRLESVGYGEERPIDDNSTEIGRAANRRVEFHITSQ